MKQTCLLCGRSALDHNLFCQEVDCPAEMSPTILAPGDQLGDLEVVKVIIVQRAAVLYEAIQNNKRLLLKVAHPGPESKDRLKREADFLRSIQASKEYTKHLPTLLSPYVTIPGVNTSLQTDAYGKSMLRGHLLYYLLFDFVEGEPLSDLLLKNPQWWIYHVGWLTFSVASTIAFLNSKQIFHLALSPQSILVHFDEKLNTPQVVLIDLGTVSSNTANPQTNFHFSGLPAYIAPELLTDSQPSPNQSSDIDYFRSEVYSLGLLLSELLIGTPVIPYHLRSDREVYQAVRKNETLEVNRMEDVEQVANIALQATSLSYMQRQKDATEFGKQLLAIFGVMPVAQKSIWQEPRTWIIVALAVLIIVLLIFSALT